MREVIYWIDRMTSAVYVETSVRGSKDISYICRELFLQIDRSGNKGKERDAESGGSERERQSGRGQYRAPYL